MKIRKRFKKMSPNNMIVIYRYISLFITSYFYVMTISQHSLARKGFIVAGMATTSIIMNYLYGQNKGDTQKIILLLIIETIGNSLLLIPSGGFQSPYIWYVLNTVLVAAIEIGSYLPWINVSVYLASIVCANYFYDRQEYSRGHLLLSDINIILGITLVTGGIQMFIRYAKEIEQKNSEIMMVNTKLLKSNMRVEETLGYVFKIYEAIHLFNSQNNSKSLINLILDYTTQVLNIKGTLFIKVEEQEDYRVHYRGLEKEVADELFKQTIKGYEEQADSSDFWQLKINNSVFNAINIKYMYRTFGILVVEKSDELEKLGFIVQLSGMLFQRFSLEEMNDMLIIEQEQNRIANEIHDSVLQKLFAVSCNLFAISESAEKMEAVQIVQELNANRTSISRAMTELRQTIYGLSSDKGGTNSFQDKIESYIKEMQKLHNIEINLAIEGDHRQLTNKEQASLYRMICEGIANAAKHGKASLIEITLSISHKEIKVIIKDNGIGFDTKEVRREETLGLGMRNMHYLAASLGGNITIKSSPSEGTVLEMSIISRESDNREKEIG